MKRSGLARDVHEILFLSFPSFLPFFTLLLCTICANEDSHEDTIPEMFKSPWGFAEKNRSDPQKFHLKHWWP